MNSLKNKITLLSSGLIGFISVVAIILNICLLFFQFQTETDRLRQTQIGIDRLTISNYLADCENKFTLSQDTLLDLYRDFDSENNFVEKNKKLARLNSELYQLLNFNENILFITIYEKKYNTFLGDDNFAACGFDFFKALPDVMEDKPAFLWNNLDYAEKPLPILPLLQDHQDIILVYMFDFSPDFLKKNIDHDLAILGERTFFSLAGKSTDFHGKNSMQVPFNGLTLATKNILTQNLVCSPAIISLISLLIVLTVFFGIFSSFKISKKFVSPFKNIADQFSATENVPLLPPPNLKYDLTLYQSLQKQLRNVIIIILSALFFIITVASSFILLNATTDSAKKLNYYHASQFNNQLSSFEYISRELLLSDPIQFYFYQYYDALYTVDDATYHTAQTDFSEIKELLSQIKNLNGYINNFVFLDNNKQPFEYLSTDSFSFSEQQNTYYSDGNNLYYSVSVLSKYKITFDKNDISNATSLRHLGYIVFSVSYKDMFTYLNASKTPTTVKLTLNDKELLSINADDSPFGMRIFKSPLTDTNNFYLEYHLSNENIFKAIQTQLLINLLQLGIGISIAAFLIKKTVKKATKQIDHFSDHLRTHDLTLYTQSTNEIQLLVDAYNNMIERISVLTANAQAKQKELAELNIKKKEMELIAYQSQLNPHFLANAMANLSSMIMTGNKDGALKFLSAISDLLKKTLYRNATIVPLKEEIDTAKAYIKIQKLRFGRKIKTSIICEEKIDNFKTLKFIIQPILENMYMHGLEPKGKGEICIKIQTDTSFLYIIITDNGVGISPEKLTEINRQLENNDSSQSLGLVNVNTRIKLNFGNEYGVFLKSEINKFCSVTLKLPILLETHELKLS